LQKLKKIAMKKLILIAATILVYTVIANAQTDKNTISKQEANLEKQESLLKKEIRKDRKKLKELNRSEVSYETKKQFIQDFGNIPDVKWETSTYYSEATFMKSGKLVTAYYDNDEGLVGTTSSCLFSDLPINAKEFINKKYSNYKIGDITFFDDNDLNETQMFIYNTPIDDEDSYFVELKNDNKKLVLQVDTNGKVYYFTRLQ
jgi:uncharacterized protein YraI